MRTYNQLTKPLTLNPSPQLKTPKPGVESYQ